MKRIFIHSWGSYSNETLVCIGVSYKEIVAWLKKEKIKTKQNALLKNAETINEVIADGCNGFGATVWDGTSLLWLKNFSNKWCWYETLLHEIHHLVYLIFKGKRMEDEREAQAYQFEYLFKTIRRKLNKRK